MMPPDDRGLLYGDGVFRTVRYAERQLLDHAAQYALLVHDCQMLGIVAPDTAALDNAVVAAIGAADAVSGVVRVTVTRGRGPRGYRPPAGSQPAVYVSAGPAPAPQAWDAGLRLRLCQLRLGHQPRLAGAKHLNRLENVMARAEWDDPAIDDGLLLGQSGEVVETTSANVFWRHGDTVFTPALNRAGVAGRQRARILESLRRSGTTVAIGHFSVGSIATADEVWACNSVIGLRAITALDEREFAPGACASRLARALFAEWHA